MILTGLGSYVVARFVVEAVRERRAKALQARHREEGAGDPTTLNPWVDPERCVCSAQCIRVCPESDVLRVIEGRAQLVNAAACVGHARCVEACPTEAIELVFGNDVRGVEVPRLAQDFESNVGGIYVAGELGGMGLIANAVAQGVAAGRAALAAQREGGARTVDADVVIVGAGPAGIAAALAVAEAGGTYVLLEQDTWGGSIRHYPRHHIVMTRDITFPGYGRVTARTMSKEQLIELLSNVITSEGVEVCERERMVSAVPRDRGFLVTTSARELRCGRVILAVGRRGTPRKLGVPGEAQAKVRYVLRDPDELDDQDVLVVGGGDSAVQAAVMLAERGRSRVTLSYRRGELTRPKAANVENLKTAVAAGRLTFLPHSRVTSIGEDTVELDVGGEDQTLPNDLVLAMTGGVLPTALLAQLGIDVETHFGREIRFF